MKKLIGLLVTLLAVNTVRRSLHPNSVSLVVRNHDEISPGLPPAPYVENIGVIPDIPLEYMTRENLMNGGRTYVQGFTDVIVGQIQSALQ